MEQPRKKSIVKEREWGGRSTKKHPKISLEQTDYLHLTEATHLKALKLPFVHLLEDEWFFQTSSDCRMYKRLQHDSLPVSLKHLCKADNNMISCGCRHGLKSLNCVFRVKTTWQRGVSSMIEKYNKISYGTSELLELNFGALTKKKWVRQPWAVRFHFCLPAKKLKTIRVKRFL